MGKTRINKHRRHFIKFWLPVLIYLILIFVLSSIPDPAFADTGIPSFDKILHTIEYAVLGFLIIRGFRNSRFSLSHIKFILLAASLGTLYGITDEFHQSFVPNRCANLGDIFFDCIGSIIGSIVYARRR